MPPWQALLNSQNLSTNVARGRTKSPRNEVDRIAVVIVQQDGSGEICGLTCGIGEPNNFAQNPDAQGYYSWELDVTDVTDTLEPKKRRAGTGPGKAVGFSLLQRAGDRVDAWRTSVTIRP
jgi:hypothetical protein